MITGITGQDGQYLSELLLSKNYEVYGLVRGANGSAPMPPTRTVPGVTLIEGDLTDKASLRRAIEIAEPDEVYNLAAMSFVSRAWEDLDKTFEVTGRAVYTLLELLRCWAGKDLGRVRFYQASTSEVFGRVSEEPQHEMTAFRPRSPYGVAKEFGHHCAVNYRDAYGLHATNGIMFNHESPRRRPEFVTRKVSQGVARIALGLQDRIELGNLDARRDWGFAGDYVKMMWQMLQQDTPEDYVIATGVTHSIREMLDVAFDEVGIDDWQQFVFVDESFVRPAESHQLVGDSSKARAQLGWEPCVGFDELIRMMVKSDLNEQRTEFASAEVDVNHIS